MEFGRIMLKKDRGRTSLYFLLNHPSNDERTEPNAIKNPLLGPISRISPQKPKRVLPNEPNPPTPPPPGRRFPKRPSTHMVTPSDFVSPALVRRPFSGKIRSPLKKTSGDGGFLAE
jgi:hypothetical protein